MIATFEKVLDEILRVGVASNAEFANVEHPGIIGDMYEGLTRDVLQASILDGCKVRVCKGKIRNKEDDFSGQIDCMVVVGDGNRIPHTDHYIYDINDVIAVIEVKKSLNRNNLQDALAHFNQVMQLRMRGSFTDDLANIASRTQRDAFRAVFRRPFPKDEASLLGKPYTRADNAMYASIRLSAPLPLLVIWGYYGHETESGFRSAVVNSVSGGDIVDLVTRPDCIFSGNFTYVKTNGMPFTGEAPRSGDRLYSYTQRGLGIRTLLNLLWYRLCMRFRRDFAILSDGRVFSFNPLLSYHVSAQGKFACHAYKIPEKSLRTIEISSPAPTLLSLEELVAMVEAANGPIDISDSDRFLNHLKELSNSALELCATFDLKNPSRLTWTSFPELLSVLTRSGFLVVEENTLRSTTSRCQVVATAHGIVGFENRDGRFNALFPAEFLEYLRRNPDNDPQKTSFFALMH